MATKRSADDVDAEVAAAEPSEHNPPSTSASNDKPMSSVIATSKKPRLALDDSVRNRRLFGVLLKGTLDAFGAKPQTEAEVRRKAVDDRLEARLVEERRLAEEAAQRERSARSVQRKESNGTVGERHGENIAQWATQKRILGNFLKTTGEETPLFYLPAKLLPSQEQQLADAQTAAEALAEETRSREEKWMAERARKWQERNEERLKRANTTETSQEQPQEQPQEHHEEASDVAANQDKPNAMEEASKPAEAEKDDGGEEEQEDDYNIIVY